MQFSHFDLMMGAKSIHAFALVAWLAQQGPGYNQTVMANMFKLLQQGAISIGKAGELNLTSGFCCLLYIYGILVQQVR